MTSFPTIIEETGARAHSSQAHEPSYLPIITTLLSNNLPLKMALMKAFVGDEKIIDRYYIIILPLQFQTNIIAGCLIWSHFAADCPVFTREAAAQLHYHDIRLGIKISRVNNYSWFF